MVLARDDLAIVARSNKFSDPEQISIDHIDFNVTAYPPGASMRSRSPFRTVYIPLVDVVMVKTFWLGQVRDQTALTLIGGGNPVAAWRNIRF